MQCARIYHVLIGNILQTALLAPFRNPHGVQKIQSAKPLVEKIAAAERFMYLYVPAERIVAAGRPRLLRPDLSHPH
jgi:hypothetical protein